MMENAVYSILSPEGFATILYKDASKNIEAAEKMKITANDLKQLGVIDDIIKEPEGGIKEDSIKTFEKIKKLLIDNINELSSITQNELTKKRYEKYRKIGG